MKAIFYTNACIEIITSKRRILCDPWLVDGAFGTWLHNPPIKTAPEDLTEYTDIYISHIHEDHFCRKTLKRLPKKVPVHLAKQWDGGLRRSIEALGFPVIEHDLWKWDDDMAFMSIERVAPNIQDTSMVIRDESGVMFNSNDELLDYAACERLNELCGGKVDVAFMPYSGASEFPSSMREYNDRDKLLNAYLKEMDYVNALVETVKRFKPKMVVPFSGSYQLAPPYDRKNTFLGISSPEFAAKCLTEAGLPATVMHEGETIYTASDLERLKTARHRMWEKQEKYGEIYKHDLSIEFDGKTYTIPMDRDTVEERQPEAPLTRLYIPKYILNRCLDREMHWNSAQLGGYIDVVFDPLESGSRPYRMLWFLTL